MSTKKETAKAIVIKSKTLTGTGLILDADERHFIITANYKFRGRPVGEVVEWEGTLLTISNIPLDVEYTLELEDYDGRAGTIKLESVKEIFKNKVRGFEYTFIGTGPLI